VAAVAEAEGVPAAQARAIPERVRAVFASLPYENSTSMRDDRRAGRPLEVEALSGAVVRRAERHGLEVPTVATIDALTRWLSDSLSGRPPAPSGGG
jgi:2-dehydropantoate 2-reductase